ncbi:MAG: hypothetical protein ACW99U_08110 [Candidatus Thorarchaeota archaeon]
MGQGLGMIVGLVAAYLMAFLVLTFGLFIPPEVIPAHYVSEFLSVNDLELKVAIVGTVLYPYYLGTYLSFGAAETTVLTFITWGTAGLLSGLLARGMAEALFASLFAVIIGAFLTWLLIFLIQPYSDIFALFGTESMLLMQLALQGCIWPGVASVVGGLLGGGISRER